MAFAVNGTFALVRRRRRRGRPRSIVLSLSDFVETDAQRMNGAPTNPIPFEAARDSGTWAEQQPLVSEDLEAEMGSRPPTVLPRPRLVAHVPVGLSDKEIARLRAENLDSQESHNDSTPNVSLPTSSPNAATESSEETSSDDARRLRSEVESLRREMERLRTHTEGLGIDAPPSYTAGDD